MKKAKKAIRCSSLATELESVLILVYILPVLCIEAWAVQLSSITSETKTLRPGLVQGQKTTQGCWYSSGFPPSPHQMIFRSVTQLLPSVVWPLFRSYLRRDPESGLNITSPCVLFSSKRKLSHDIKTVGASGECRDHQNSGIFWG